MRWPLTFYTDSAILFRKDWMAAATFGSPAIFLRPKYRDDEGLYQHELTHVRQFFRNPLMALWYLGDLDSRAEYEAEAYAKQTLYPDRKGRFMPVELGAYRMHKDYGLALTQDQCADLIRSFLPGDKTELQAAQG